MVVLLRHGKLQNTLYRIQTGCIGAMIALAKQSEGIANVQLEVARQPFANQHATVVSLQVVAGHQFLAVLGQQVFADGVDTHYQGTFGFGAV